MTGLHLSQYRIDDELGRGGMGIVYKATDTKLNRTVALKVLPPSALASEDDRARFFREAQAAAQLHHPNIATVFQIDEAVPVDDDGKVVEGHTEKRPFIAMELIEGETLADYIKKGPVKLQDAANIAAQVAEALKAAHAKEIVHRDIKSANVMLTGDGIAKVLDFGLAKTNASTMLTRLGSTLGTVAYMSPEQARGQEVDGRTDLYALGTMLYEMVAGRLPFAGDYEQAILYAILNEPPEPLTAVRTGVPMDLERVVAKLLAKEADYRYQTAADLIADLKSLDLTGSGVSRRSMAAVSAAAVPIEQAPSRIPSWIWGAMAGVAFIAAGLAWVLKPAPPVDAPVRHLQLSIDRFSSGRWPVLSESGRYLAMGGTDTSAALPSLHILDLEKDQIAEISSSAYPAWPRFSEDEQRVAFVSGSELMVAPVTGGEPSAVAEAGSEPIVWGLDGSIYFTNSARRLMVAGPDGSVRLFEFADTSRTTGFYPSHLMPDGGTLLGNRDTASGAVAMMIDLESGVESVLVDRDAWYVRYVAPNHLVVQSGPTGTLSAIPFDPSAMAVIGLRVPILIDTAAYQWSVTESGHFVSYAGSGGAALELVELGEDGSTSSVVDEKFDYEEFQLSSDGTQVVTEINGYESGTDQIVLFDLQNGTRRQLTFDSAHFEPSFSPDDRQFVLVGVAGGSQNLGIMRVDGVGGMRWITDTPTVTGNPDWSPAGDWVAYDEVNGATGRDIFLYSLADSTSEVLISRDRDQQYPRISPDGRHVAYGSDETRNQEVFVVDLETRTPRLVSRRGGAQPVWGPTGRTLYYRRGSDLLMVDIETAVDSWSVGPEQVVAEVGTMFFFDVAPTGRIVIGRSTTQPSTLLDVVLNWESSL